MNINQKTEEKKLKFNKLMINNFTLRNMTTDINNDFSRHRKYSLECGISGLTTTNRVLGGQVAKIGK